MEYSYQCYVLRRPHDNSNPSEWSLYHTSDVWQRLVERTVVFEPNRRARKRQKKIQIEQAQKQALIEELLNERLPVVLHPMVDVYEENKAYEGFKQQQNKNVILHSNLVPHTNCGPHNKPASQNNGTWPVTFTCRNNFVSNENEYHLDDDNEDDDDDENDDTIYSNCIDSLQILSTSSSEMSSSDIQTKGTKGDISSSSGSTDIGACINMKYQSFNWADHVEDSQTVEAVFDQEQMANGFSCTRESSESLFISHLEEEEKEEVVELDGHWNSPVDAQGDYSLLGYGIDVRAPGRLGECCAWTLSPLPCSLEDFSAYGRVCLDLIPAVNYIPAVVITDENGIHFHATEVKNPLSEQEIADIRLYRESADTETWEERKRRLEWYESFERRKTKKELRAASIARQWWEMEQEKRDAKYEGWEAEEAKEYDCLRQNIQTQVEKILIEQKQAHEAANWRSI